ncbi:hypothetical protein [Alistipes sp. ZOR0009]|uniref:hypothetical protein n=1 Tax=Alistipes sp. ZOR0009 TaxID=1339253 RepID=UPI00064790AB|nr:hypothetical protein [Alistipes sp. ZOR0009]
MTTDSIIEVILFASPLLFAGIIALINNSWINRVISRFSEWIDQKYQQSQSLNISGWLSFILAGYFWLIWKPIIWTKTISHTGLMSGVRITAMLYSIAIILFISYFAVIVAIAILILYIAYKLVIAMLEKATEKEEGIATSFWDEIWNDGKKKHYNPNGEVIYETKETEGLLGDKQTEYYGLDGQRYATTSKDKTWDGTEYDHLQYEDGREERHFKQYGESEYRDEDGKKIGSDKECKTFFGDEYIEHLDKDRFVEGTSRIKTEPGIFQDKKYIEYHDSKGNIIREKPINE